MRSLQRGVATGALVLLITGCSGLHGAEGTLLSGEWRLQAGTNQGAAIPIVSGHPITLKIDGTQVGGSAACNSYGGKVEVDGTTAKITALMQTEMACQGDDVMASEAAYLAALPRVTSAARDGDGLVLRGPQMELRFTSVPPVPDADLIGPVWTLDSLVSGEVASSVIDAPTLRLGADGTLAASTGCRDLTGRYTIAGNTVQVTFDPYDMIGCADPLGSQDTHVLRVLGAADGFIVRIQGSSMTLAAGELGLSYRVVAAGS